MLRRLIFFSLFEYLLAKGVPLSGEVGITLEMAKHELFHSQNSEVEIYLVLDFYREDLFSLLKKLIP